MVGIDANVLIKYFLQDESNQTKAANSFFEFLGYRGAFVSQIALIECIWVLSRVYKQTKEEVIGIIRVMLASPKLVLESSQVIARAIETASVEGIDIADAIIAQSAKHHGCDTTFTFDKRAAHCNNMTLLD